MCSGGGHPRVWPDAKNALRFVFSFFVKNRIALPKFHNSSILLFLLPIRLKQPPITKK
jgi:hypothetical protein